MEYEGGGLDAGALDLQRNYEVAGSGDRSRGFFGAAVGAGAGLGLALAVCTNRETCNAGLLLGAAALGGIVGAGIMSLFSHDVLGKDLDEDPASRFLSSVDNNSTSDMSGGLLVYEAYPPAIPRALQPCYPRTDPNRRLTLLSASLIWQPTPFKAGGPVVPLSR